MSMPPLKFTEAGRALQLKALAGAELNFLSLALGDGVLGGQVPGKLTQLIHPVVSVEIGTMTRGLEYVTLRGPFDKSALGAPFWWRELGVMAQDPDLGPVLYCYANAGDLGEYITPDGQLLERMLAVDVIVGDAANLSAVISGSLLYATLDPATGRVRPEQLPVIDVAASIQEHDKNVAAHEDSFAAKVPVRRTVNGKALAEDIILTAGDIKIDDETAVFLGLNPVSNQNVNDALLASVLASKNACLVYLSVTVGGKPARADILINGLTGLSGGNCLTDAKGMAIGFSFVESTTISSLNYIDLPSSPKTINTPLKTIVRDSFVMGPARAGDTYSDTTVEGIVFSSYTGTVDVHVIDGGVRGNDGQYNSATYYIYGGRGGAEGRQGYKLGIKPQPNLANPLYVGSASGKSSFLGVTGNFGGLSGGTPAIVDNAHVNPEGQAPSTPGVNSTTKLFGTGAVVGGGSGGGGGAYSGGWERGFNGSVGGQPGGGSGGSSGSAGYPGTQPGAGGGGGSVYLSQSSQAQIGGGGAGMSGRVYYRWRILSS